MDEESLSRICMSAFSDSDILEAKNLLFEAIPTTSKRKITRKKEGKKLREIEDIISLLKVTNPNDTPVFVARELHKLPPVLFDHVDVTKLLKDLTRMRCEIEEIKLQYVSSGQLEPIKRDIADLKKCTSVKSPCYVNTTRRSGKHMLDSCEYDSGPMGLQHVPVIDKNDQNPVTTSQTISPPTHDSSKSPDRNIHNTEAISEQNEQGGETGLGSQLRIDNTAPKHVAASQNNNSTAVHHEHTAAAVAQLTTEPQSKTFAQIVSEGEWTLVQQQRRKLRNRFVGNIGKAVIDSNSKFKAFDEKVVLYIYNVDKQVTQTDIIDYIEEKAKLRVGIEKMIMKVPKSYDAYKISVPKHKYEDFMRDDFWPEGISFRKFIDFSKKKTDRKYSENECLQNING